MCSWTLGLLDALDPESDDDYADRAMALCYQFEDLNKLYGAGVNDEAHELVRLLRQGLDSTG